MLHSQLLVNLYPQARKNSTSTSSSAEGITERDGVILSIKTQGQPGPSKKAKAWTDNFLSHLHFLGNKWRWRTFCVKFPPGSPLSNCPPEPSRLSPRPPHQKGPFRGLFSQKYFFLTYYKL